MPWTTADVDSHKKGLSAKQKRQWVHVANSSMKRCEDAGEGDCEGRAIRMANSVVSKDAPDDLCLVFEAKIAKTDDTRRRIFGYASIAVLKDGRQLIDLQGDVIEIDDLAEGWYGYVKTSGRLNFLHESPCSASLIEAVVFTPEKLAVWGLPPDALPLGAWVGYELDEESDYALVKASGYFMFSIQGFSETELV